MPTPEETLAIAKWAASVGEKPVQFARLRWVPDLEPFDSSFLDGLGLSEKALQVARESLDAVIDREGVWGLIAETQCPCCGSWTKLDALWSIVGQDETLFTDVRAWADAAASEKGFELAWI